MLFLSLFIVLPVVNGAIFVKDIARQTRNSKELLLLYSKIRYSLKLVGEFDASPYSYDEECLSIYRTNDWLFANCELPANCSSPLIEKIDKTWLGQETILCHGVHPIVDSPKLTFYTIGFTPETFSFPAPIPLQHGDVVTFRDFFPVSFFEWFYVVRGGDGFAIIPKFCSETFRNSTTFPPNVGVTSNGDSLCLSRVLYDHTDCRPKRYFHSLRALFMNYDFPVNFEGVPFSQGSYSDTNNGVIGADVYRQNYSDYNPHHVYQKVGGVYMVSYHSYDDPGPVYIVKSSRVLPVEGTDCFPIHSRYHSPLDVILMKVSNFLREEIDYLIEFLLIVAERLASVIFSVLGELLNLLSALIPYGELFYTSLFLACITYLFTRDVLISVFPNVCIYLVRIYFNSVKK
nr:MAG: ORF2 [Utsjoki negevirus 1]